MVAIGRKMEVVLKKRVAEQKSELLTRMNKNPDQSVNVRIGEYRGRYRPHPLWEVGAYLHDINPAVINETVVAAESFLKKNPEFTPTEQERAEYFGYPLSVPRGPTVRGENKEARKYVAVETGWCVSDVR